MSRRLLELALQQRFILCLLSAIRVKPSFQLNIYRSAHSRCHWMACTPSGSSSKSCSACSDVERGRASDLLVDSHFSLTQLSILKASRSSSTMSLAGNCLPILLGSNSSNWMGKTAARRSQSSSKNCRGLSVRIRSSQQPV